MEDSQRPMICLIDDNAAMFYVGQTLEKHFDENGNNISLWTDPYDGTILQKNGADDNNPVTNLKVIDPRSVFVSSLKVFEELFFF